MTAPAGVQILHIAAREMDVGLRSKQFYISMAVSIVFIVAIVLVPRLLSSEGSETTVAVSGSAAQRDAFVGMTAHVPGVDVVDDDADTVIDLAATPPTVV